MFDMRPEGIESIVLDPGHGAGAEFNRGSVIGHEGENNFHYALDLKEALEKYGFKVTMTRQKITDNPSLSARGGMAKDKDLFLSLHSNAMSWNSPYFGKVRGVEVWDDTNAKYSNERLAALICDKVSRRFQIPNRGVKYRRDTDGLNWYGVLRSSFAKSSMLVEHVFHDNPEDCYIYVHRRKEMARIVAEAVAEHYKRPLLQTDAPTVPTASELDKAQKWAVDSKIMSDSDWTQEKRNSAWWLYTYHVLHGGKS